MARRVGITLSLTALSSRARIVRTAAIVSGLRKYNEGFVEEVIEEAQDYPDEENSGGRAYVRTYTLRDSWKARDTSTGSRISYTLENYARDPRGRYYARRAHSNTTQSRNLADVGWRTIGEIMEVVGTRREFHAGAQTIITKLL